MAQEYIHDSYYQSSHIKWVDIHQSNKISIEAWLSKLLFHDNLKRIVYCTPDIAFRRRIETLDTGKDDSKPLKSEMLNLPFASFCMTGGLEPDDRYAAVNATEAVTGLYYDIEDRLMRTIAVKTKYKVTCFFSRQDDVRFAEQLLFQEKTPEHPVWMHNTVKWRNINIDLPTYVTIESINTNPEYKETDWLKENRIFTIEVELTSRSYLLTINNVDKIIQLPMRFASYKDEFEEDEYTEFLTEEVALDWASKKFDIDIDTDKIDKDNEEYKFYSPYFVNQYMSDAELEQGCAIPNKYLTSTIRSYFQEDTACILNSWLYDDVRSTYDKVRLAFKIKPSTFKYFDHMTITIPTKKPIEVTDCHAMEAFITDLYPNSTYKATFTLYSTNGTLQQYYLTFTTKNNDKNLAPSVTQINKEPVQEQPTQENKKQPLETQIRSPGLVGMRF